MAGARSRAPASGGGIFRDGGCRQCRLPDPAPLDGVGVVITGRHVGGLLAIVARVKPIAVIVAVESSRHSFRRWLPGWATTAGTGAPARNLGGRVHARSEPTGTTERRMGTGSAVARRIAKRLPSPRRTTHPKHRRAAAHGGSESRRQRSPSRPAQSPTAVPPGRPRKAPVSPPRPTAAIAAEGRGAAAEPDRRPCPLKFHPAWSGPACVVRWCGRHRPGPVPAVSRGVGWSGRGGQRGGPLPSPA